MTVEVHQDVADHLLVRRSPARRPLPGPCMLWRTNLVEADRVEHAEHQRVHPDHHVPDGRGEVAPQLSSERSPGCSSLLVLSRRRGCADSSVRRRGRLAAGAFLRRQLQEDLLEAHSNRPQLQEPPAGGDDGPRQFAPDVPPRLRCPPRSRRGRLGDRPPRRASRPGPRRRRSAASPAPSTCKYIVSDPLNRRVRLVGCVDRHDAAPVDDDDAAHRSATPRAGCAC